MATTPATPLSIKLASTRWLWAVRVAAVISLLVVFIPISWTFVSFHGHQCSEIPRDFGVLLFASIPVMMAYLHILWRLRRKAEKSGLGLAMVWGSLMFLLSTLFLLRSFLGGTKSGLGDLLGLGFFALIQAAMVASTSKADDTPSPQPHDWQALARGFMPAVAYFLLLFALVAVAQQGHGTRGMAANQASAVGSLRTINAAEVTYAETYKTGYSPTLGALAEGPNGARPSAWAAGLIDSVLAIGRKSGYSFVYIPGPKDSAGRIKSYTVVARPLEYVNCGTNSYFTDESGVIRQTSDNRPATAKDPPLAGRILSLGTLVLRVAPHAYCLSCL